MGCMATYVKKTIELDKDALKAVRSIFDTKTDKDAVNQALRLVAEEEEIIRTHASLAGKVELDTLFE
jgi:Arc/MetJ family transcription regulator